MRVAERPWRCSPRPASNGFGAGPWNPEGTLTVTGAVIVTFAIAK
jgi:hypothetical protein